MVFLVENYAEIHRPNIDHLSKRSLLYNGEPTDRSCSIRINDKALVNNSNTDLIMTPLKESSASSLGSEYYYDDTYDDMLTTRSSESSTTLSSASSTLTSSSSANIISNTPIENEEDNIFHVYLDEDIQTDDNQLDYEFINQICEIINQNYHEVNSDVSKLVSDCGDLKLNKKFWNYLMNKFNLFSRNKSRVLNDLNRLLTCLIKIEKSLAKYLAKNFKNDFMFDSEFLLNITFLFYENCQTITKIYSKSESFDNFDSVFELDNNISMPPNFTFENLVFEINLNNLIENFLNKYLGKLINNDGKIHENFIGSTKLVISFYTALFKHELFNEDCDPISKCDYCLFNLTNRPILNDIIDIHEYLLQPNWYLSENLEFTISNPITQSYKCFLSNLNRLNLYAIDPQLLNDCEDAYDSDANNSFDKKSNISFGYFVASFYTMGYFEIRSFLFDTKFQHIYELKQFNNEFRNLFKNDMICEEWKSKTINETFGGNYELFMCLFETDPKKGSRKSTTNRTQQVLRSYIKNSRWKFEKKAPAHESKPREDQPKLSIFDEIMQRISTLNTSLLFNSYIKFLNDGRSSLSDISCVDKSSRNWTVAPKIFSMNSSNIMNQSKMGKYCCVSGTISSPTSSPPFDTTDHESLSKVASGFWPKIEQKPIGSKPASMFNTGSSSASGTRYRGVKSTPISQPQQIQTDKKSSEPVQKSSFMHRIFESCQNIWRQEDTTGSGSNNTYTSPFISYNNEPIKLNEHLKLKTTPTSTPIVVNTIKSGDIIKRTRPHLNSIGKSISIDQAPKTVGKYSVAPMCITSNMSNFKKHTDMPYSNNTKINQSSTVVYRPSRVENIQLSPQNISPYVNRCVYYTNQPYQYQPPQQPKTYQKNYVSSFSVNENDIRNNYKYRQNDLNFINGTNIPLPPSSFIKNIMPNNTGSIRPGNPIINNNIQLYNYNNQYNTNRRF